MDQYKEAVRILNMELTAVIEKLKQESNLLEKVQKAKESLKIELTTPHEQMEKAKANAVVDFKAQQSFINACAVYYGEGFDDCLKQVGSVYPDLDLSKVSMDDSLSTTPASGDSFSDETDNSTHTKPDPKDDGVVLAQPAIEGPVAPLVPSAEDPPTKDAENPLAKDGEILSTEDVQNIQLSLNFDFLVSHFQTILSALLVLGLICKHFILFMVYV